MAEWKHFPLWDARPSDVKIFTEKERSELELIISLQTTSLLGSYGLTTCIEVDNSDCSNVDGSQSFYTIEVDPFVLEDDSELVVQQVPILRGELNTSKGLHCIQKNDEDGMPLLEFAVWDPEIDTEERILSNSGARVSIDTLQELYEALTICIFTAAQSGEVNIIEHDTTSYPIPVIEPEMQNIVDSF